MCIGWRHLIHRLDSGEVVLDKQPELLDFTALTRGRQRCFIDSTEDRGICLFQFRSLLQFMASHTPAGANWRNADAAGDILVGWHDNRTGDRIHLREISLYQLVDWVILPSTKKEMCSFVELISQDAVSQKPMWFVSHWWGEPVADFVQCIETQKSLRQLPDTTAYWVCAYANNQWCLNEEIVRDPAETPFRKAMAACIGTLPLLTAEASFLHEVGVATSSA